MLFYYSDNPPYLSRTMAFDLEIPLYSFVLSLSNGEQFRYFLSDPDTLQYGASKEDAAKRYAESLQKNRLNKGIYASLLQEVQSGTGFERKEIIVPFSAAADRVSYPAFSLSFTYFFREHGKGFLAFIPALGAETFSTLEEDLDKRVTEAVRLEFTREQRLKHIQEVVETLWYERADIEFSEHIFSIPTLQEAEEMSLSTSERLLPSVAKKTEIKQQVFFGGEIWLKQAINALKSNFGRSVLLIGASGVGKTALVREIVRRKEDLGVQGEVWETSASVMIKELTKDTGWQDGLANLAKELSETGDILFVRNLADLFEVGQYEGNDMSMAEYLRGFIGRGEMVVATECTPEAAARIELKAPGFLSLFNIIRMAEPKGKELSAIITQKTASFSGQQEIKIKPAAVQEIIRLHRRFMPYSGFPGKPIRFLESVILGSIGRGLKELSQTEIIQAFAEESGMPKFMIDPKEPMYPDKIESDFNRQVFGQEHAVSALTGMLATVKTALSRTNKPIASFLFVGPTGVGKTELGKVLADFMFGDRNRLSRFDMSEFSNPYTVQRLVGTPNADGLLTSAVRRQPFSVILFDEIEKAAGNFYDLLLQVLSEGRLTDGRGKTVNFCSTIIIMTSNIGAGDLQTKRIAWSKEVAADDITQHFITAAEKHFRPELFNRIDRIVPFTPLTAESMRFILQRELSLLKKREGLEFRNVDLEISDEAKEFLSKKGYDPRYGARYLQRSLRESLVIPLAKKLNNYPWEDKVTVLCDVVDDEVVINLSDDPLSLDLLLEELEKTGVADLTAGLRRAMDGLYDSFTFLKFSDAVMLAKEEQKQNGYQYSAAHEGLFTLEKTVKKLQGEIEAMEEEIGLVCLNLQPYLPNINEEIEAWQMNLQDLKIDMLSLVNPDKNTCTFRIFGKAEKLPDLDKQYRRLFAAFNMDIVEAEALWFRSEYFEEHVLNEAENVTEPRRAYLMTNITRQFKEEPERPGDRLIGLRFFLRSKLCHLILQEEAGLQSLESDAGENLVYMVEVDEKFKRKTAENAHRKDYFKGTIRRTRKNGLIKDSIYKTDRELKDIPEFPLDELVERFAGNLEEML